MTTARKKAGPPGGVGSPEYKAAQEGKNKAMAAALSALPMAKRTRGRPGTTGTTPAKERKAKERATATQQGGERLHVMLTAEGARNLRQIMDTKKVGKTEAVHIVLAGAITQAAALPMLSKCMDLLSRCLDDEFGISSKALRADIEELLR